MLPCDIISSNKLITSGSICYRILMPISLINGYCRVVDALVTSKILLGISYLKSPW
jgi:hypothetical protein